MLGGEAAMKIKELRRRYPDEWLLIRITAVDRQDQPVEGGLIAHSKNRDDIYNEQMKRREDLYITYTGKMPEKGYAVAFHGKSSI